MAPTTATLQMGEELLGSAATTIDAVPRLHWDDQDHRFHYRVPVASEPGVFGFLLMQEMKTPDGLAALRLPTEERRHLEQMERVNHMIEVMEASEHLRESVRFLEKRRTHSEEFHERILTEEDLKPRTARKKDTPLSKTSPKHSHEVRRQRPTRVHRVQQP